MAIYPANAGTTYPILMQGLQNGIHQDYNCGYHYYFVIDGDGIIRWRGDWDEATVRQEVATAVAELGLAGADAPRAGHRLLAAYPNPFNPQVRLPYELAGDSATADVVLEIVDVRGRVRRTLVQGPRATGQRHEAVWNGRDAAGRRLASGPYLVRLTVDGASQSRFVAMIK